MPRLLARFTMTASLLASVVSGEWGWCEQQPTLAVPPPLAAAIDTLVEQAAVGPSAALCSDADFVRRIHLDLVGRVPAPDEVRRFLAEEAPDRRQRLIDALMGSREFVRQMGLVLDAMLLERSSPPSGLAEPWQAWLRASLAQERPLDDLLGEMVAVEGGDPASQPAAAFLLARSAEPVKMTRALGRIFFGRDLQCAQCHDHPLDDNIRQAEFHGLHAFVKRTSLFTSGKAQQLSETVTGEVDFASVFTDEAVKAAWPQLPDGPPVMEEPVVEPGDGYVTTPSKSSRGVPHYSRRAALAERLSGSEMFRRNLANRLWAVFFGKGLVHPLDGLGPDNTPSHPRLLDRLATALIEHDYQLRPLVRGIVSSRTYQRAVEPPLLSEVDAAGLQEQVAVWEREEATLSDRLADLQTAAEDAEAAREEAFAAERAIHEQLQPTIAVRSETRKSFNDVATKATAAEAARDQAAAVAAAVEGALAEARAASELLAGDAAVTGVVAALEAQQQTRETAAQKALAAAEEQEAAKATAEEKLTAARQAFDEVAKQRSPQTLAERTRLAEEATRRFVAAQQDRDRVLWRLELLSDMQTALDLRHEDPLAAEVLWTSVEERLTDGLQVARLRPLSPDQFALSFLQASGALARLEHTAADAVAKKPPQAVTDAAEAQREQVREVAVEQELLKQAGSVMKSFSGLYADPLVEGFQATLNQALYLGNAPQVAAELTPQGDNLAARLLATEDMAAAADELCVTVFSRPATEDEITDITTFLAVADDERPRAVAELIWAMLSSNEFRFQH